MRFRQQHQAKLPQVDLIPMLNVMMGILAFFVMITMTLGSEQLIEVQLPAEQQPDEPAPLPTDPFIVELAAPNQVRLNGQPIDVPTLQQQMETYLGRNPDNVVFLLPNRDLPYEDVMQFLGEMRAVGGDRVSLAIEE
ncbi:Putative biopolymer transport protein ExbD [Halomicronema hongdechloris C2206]|uniref:Biopolymer transport protein ExbD n=1 Tax=Halomicronema hongdechloris C2206 TaxID=1641165 RepID=A0A1Z3HU07_9CYAN|nr:biopolymer transporter ExbD [Halomicronema hongdechloris]ASC73783.1 Putative biopolymer transport protein ExbD [Halomicronema hongdechloris C2206]